MAQVVEYLPSMYEALGSIPSTEKKRVGGEKNRASNWMEFGLWKIHIKGMGDKYGQWIR
jgi:hypothetical protein